MKKMIAGILAAALTVCTFAGCSGTSASTSSGTVSQAAGSTSASASTLSGTISISGSSALQPLVKAAADSFKVKNTQVAITVNAGGSGTGLQNVSDKTVDIGNSDVFAEEKLTAEKATELVDHIVCVVGVAAVVNPQAGVDNVTKQQLIDIFTGKITNWKDLGGSDQAIVIINRPKSSGTRTLFKAYALDGNEEASGQALTEDNSGTLKQTVAQTPGAIAYLAFSYLTDSTVNALSIDGIAPNYENVYSGKYPVWGYEHMYTNGTPTGAVKAFLDYFSDSECEMLIVNMGYGVSSKMTVTRSAPAVSGASSK